MNDGRLRIDDAIDRAVRDIMRRDPPAGFRGRVLSRLDAPVRRALTWPRLAAAAGTLAVVALAVVLLRDAPPEPSIASSPVAATPPAVPSPASDAVQPRVNSAPVTGPPPRRQPRAEPVRTATFPPRDGRVSAASLPPAAARNAPSAPALEETMPSALPPIGVAPLAAPGPIEIAPIVVPPIQIPRVPSASPPR